MNQRENKHTQIVLIRFGIAHFTENVSMQTMTFLLFFCTPPLVSVCFMIKWSDSSSGQKDLTKRDYQGDYIVMLISVFMVQPFPCDPLIITNIYRAPHEDNNIILNGMYHSWNDINSFGSVTIFGIIDRRVNMKWAMIARYESRIDVTYRDRSTHFANSFI